MAGYGKSRQVRASAHHGHGQSSTTDARTITSPRTNPLDLAPKRFQNPADNFQPGHSGNAKRVPNHPNQIHNGLDGSQGRARPGSNIALDGAPKKLQNVHPNAWGTQQNFSHQHMDSPAHGTKAALAGISTTQAAAILNGDKLPTDPPVKGKVQPQVEAAFGQRSRVAEVYPGAPGQHHANRSAGINHSVAGAVLGEAVMSGSTMLPNATKAVTSGQKK
jgi:hypothetical protein